MSPRQLLSYIQDRMPSMLTHVCTFLSERYAEMFDTDLLMVMLLHENLVPSLSILTSLTKALLGLCAGGGQDHRAPHEQATCLSRVRP
jgi:hypothetical protein